MRHEAQTLSDASVKYGRERERKEPGSVSLQMQHEIGDAAPHLARDLRSSVPRLHSYSPSDANKLRIKEEVEGGKGRARLRHARSHAAHAAEGGKKLITRREDASSRGNSCRSQLEDDG